jgi:hypothetical protein
MNIKQLFILCFILLCGKIDLKAEKIKGKIIYDKDTSHVVFNISIEINGSDSIVDYIPLQNSIQYDSMGVKKYITPIKANEIQFTINGKLISMHSIANTLGPVDYSKPIPRMFLKLELDGKARIFNYYYLKDQTNPLLEDKFTYNPDSVKSVNNLVTGIIIDAIKKKNALVNAQILKKGTDP